MNKSEKKALSHTLYLMYSESIFMDVGNRVEVDNANTINNSDAVDDVGDAIFPMYLEVTNITSLTIALII